ncbi:EF-hand domain-containing family member C2-like [Acyrthosiphon pisum]|uniref:DM10 domain-containing protein n=1 Tax=Acyrthosiphon pisum TaxID=7029 RepID=A0A8R2A5W5_ACYPI|nr:EF-hand domain-containing family member C2-like [Acyrthosiphon pisum]|eukprot:XP_001949545.2 PREDICTED: EF-hand domain-containing family member C2-like [Acyrthosiphon pisum]
MDQCGGSILPKIPGIYQTYLEVKDKYPIGSDLECIDKVRFIKSIEKKNERLFCDPDVAMVMLAKGRNVINQRNWLAFDDKEVLTFYAFYKKSGRGSSAGIKYTLKQLKIIYFLVDETIQVNEPTKQNSGGPQGCFIKKQKIPLPGCDQETGPYYRLPDLVVGTTVIFHGKELRITGVDAYTRDFLHTMGVPANDNEPMPEDPYYEYRKKTALDVTLQNKANIARNPPPNGYDSLILRFRGYWDDRNQMDGDLHFYEVLYYLADDTMELVEEIMDDTKVSGIRNKMIVKRQRLMKEGPWCLQPGYNVRQDILNVMTTNKNSFYYTMDSQLGIVQKVPYYNRTDLFIGQVLNVYGRSVILVSCDEFTKSFYKNVYQLGEENLNPIEAPKTVREIEEEMLQQKRVEIILKNYDEVLRKSLVKDGGPGIIFGFLIKMITDDPINQSRNFMLKYYLDDTEFAIYEYRETNSGMRGGMFRSKRGFSENQDQENLFIFHQLAVGVKICIDEFKFTIVDIDDKTLQFMIDNPKEFSHSNLAAVRSKTREMINSRFSSLEKFRTEYFQDRELVDRDEFRKVLSFDGELDPHIGVVLSLIHKRPDPFEPFTDNVLRSVVQREMRKDCFIHFDGLKNNFRSRKSKSDEVGYIVCSEAIKAMKSNRISLSEEIRSILVNKFTDTKNGCTVNYEEMVEFMDYMKNPVEPPSRLARELLFVKPKKVLVRVNDFIDGLRSET